MSTPRKNPIFMIDPESPYAGTVAYLTFGTDVTNFIRLRIGIPPDATPQAAAKILRIAAEQLELNKGPMMRLGEELFLDAP